MSLWLVFGCDETAPWFALGVGADGAFVDRSTARIWPAIPARSSECARATGGGAVTAGVAGVGAGAGVATGVGVTGAGVGAAVTAGVVAAGAVSVGAGVDVGAAVVSVGAAVVDVGAAVVSVGVAGVVSVGPAGAGAGAGAGSVGGGVAVVVLVGSGGAVVPSVGVAVGGLSSTGVESGGGSPHVGSVHAVTGVLEPQLVSSGAHCAGGRGSMSSASLVRTDRIRPSLTLSRACDRINGCVCEAIAAPADAGGIRVAAVTSAATPTGTSAGGFVSSPTSRGRHRGQSRRYASLPCSNSDASRC
jgi:hypothetical protein